MIKVFETRDGETYYGAVNGEGEVVLATAYTKLSSVGDFLVAEGGVEQSERYVFSHGGAKLLTLSDLSEVKDIGGGYFSVVSGESSAVYDQTGKNVLPGTGLDDTYEYSSCGNFILARSEEKGSTLVFHALTSDIKLSFFDTESTSYSVAYVGGGDFVAVKTEVADASSYDVALDRGGETTYYKQIVRRYTVGVENPVTLDPGRFIVQIANRYSIGLTEADRASFSLKDGFNAVAYYKTEGKKATGALCYYVADGGLKPLKVMPDGVSPLFTLINGVGATLSSSGDIVFLNESGDEVGRVNDAAYQDIVFSGEVVVASKIVGSNVKRGAINKNGAVVIPFEYSYISAFAGEKAVASKGGKTYVVTANGAETYICDEAFPHYFDGFYKTTAGTLVGITSLDGVSLVSPVYQGFAAVRRYGDVVYAALTLGSVTDVYRLY